MALHPPREATTGAAHIDIITGREGKESQFPHSNCHLPFQGKEESIGSFFAIHLNHFMIQNRIHLPPVPSEYLLGVSKEEIRELTEEIIGTLPVHLKRGL